MAAVGRYRDCRRTLDRPAFAAAVVEVADAARRTGRLLIRPVARSRAKTAIDPELPETFGATPELAA